MNARNLSAVCVSLLLVSALAVAQAPLLVTPAPASAPTVQTVPAAPQVPTKAYVVMDYSTGRVLAEQNARIPLEPASITKLMTGYLVFSAIRDKRLRLDEEVVISEHAWRSEGSRTFVPKC